MFGKMPKPKIGKSQGTPTVPGTQRTTGVGKQPARVDKVNANNLKAGFLAKSAKRVRGMSAGKEGKEIAPRAPIVSRAKPKAEY
jgi:hypothetical protein